MPAAKKTTKEKKEKEPEKAAAKESAPAQRAAPRQSNLGTPVSIIVAGVIVAGAIVLTGGDNNAPAAAQPTAGTGQAQQQPTGPSQEELQRLLTIQPDDYVRGNRNADVYIVEFSDPECPFCKQFHATMKQIIAEYGDRIAWVYRHFPLAQLHSKAPREAEALECANELGGPNAFWAYADRIYEITPSNNGLDDSQLPEIAAYVGLNKTAFTTCLDSGRHTADVEADFQNALDTGGTGTPHSLIVTSDAVIPIRGAQPFATVKAQLDQVLQ